LWRDDVASRRNRHPAARQHRLDDLWGHPPAGRQAAPALPLVGARIEYEDGNIVRLKSVTGKAMKQRDRDGRR